MAPFTGGLQGDLQTVVQALQALTIKLGDLINEFHSSTTGHAETIGDAIAAMQDPKAYSHIGAAGSTLIHTGETSLFGVVVNNRDATGTTFTTLTIYDGTSTGGTVVGAVTFRSDTGLNYGLGGLHLSTGLFVVAAGTPVDLTLIWNAG